MPFIDFYNELTGYIPKLSTLLAQTLINRAWRDIRESRPWSFLVDEDALVSPGLLTAGTVALTQYTNTLVGDTTAQAAWNAISVPLITQRQFRVPGGPIYSIIGYDDTTGTITLDRNYNEATNAAASYVIFRCYYPAPKRDFLRWVSVFDPVNGYWLRLHWTRAEIDRIDPQRGYLGDPTRVVSYKADSNPASSTYQFPMFELWACPSSQVAYQAIYQRRGDPFVDDGDDLPPAIQEDVLMFRARRHAYEWAEANKGRMPELRGVDWRFLMSQADAEYKAKLHQAQLKDEETFMQNWVIPNDPECYLSPIDSKFAQSHDVNW